MGQILKGQQRHQLRNRQRATSLERCQLRMQVVGDPLCRRQPPRLLLQKPLLVRNRLLNPKVYGQDGKTPAGGTTPRIGGVANAVDLTAKEARARSELRRFWRPQCFKDGLAGRSSVVYCDYCHPTHSETRVSNSHLFASHIGQVLSGTRDWPCTGKSIRGACEFNAFFPPWDRGSCRVLDRSVAGDGSVLWCCCTEVSVVRQKPTDNLAGAQGFCFDHSVHVKRRGIYETLQTHK